MADFITADSKTVAISQDERQFFIALGGRIAALRKAAHLTQVQLAEVLGVAQSTINAYEMGQRRVPVSALPVLARALGVDLETLMGEGTKRNGKRGPAPKFQQQIERISQLPKTKQRFVMDMLDTVLAQQGR